MALSNKEKQRRFRERMRAKGYKQTIVWVKTGKERTREMRNAKFARSLEKIAEGLTGAQTEKFFKAVLRSAKKLRKEINVI